MVCRPPEREISIDLSRPRPDVGSSKAATRTPPWKPGFQLPGYTARRGLLWGLSHLLRQPLRFLRNIFAATLLKFWSSFFKSLRRWRARSPPRASQRAKSSRRFLLITDRLADLTFAKKKRRMGRFALCGGRPRLRALDGRRPVAAPNNRCSRGANIIPDRMVRKNWFRR